MRYFLSHDGNRQNYLTRIGLYRQGVNDTAAERLVYDDNIQCPQLAGDFVYYLKEKNANLKRLMQLCRVNAKTANQRGDSRGRLNLYSFKTIGLISGIKATPVFIVWI
jgi:hypothetical protein